MTFRGKVALVTGAASGMGQLSAWRLAAEGVSVAALDVDEGGLAVTARRAPSVTSITCDVADWTAVQQAVDHVENQIGPIDRVVNAAAIAPTAPVLDQQMDEIERMTRINYLGSVHVAKATLPAMIERHRGDFIQYASLAGWLPAHHFGAYSATKFAVVAFTETLYHENLDAGLRMVCVCPPIVDTPLLDQVGRSASHLISASKVIRPETVLDAIEVSLEKGEFFVYPGPGTRLTAFLRRLAPSLLWKQLSRVEAGEGLGPLGALQGASSPPQDASSTSPADHDDVSRFEDTAGTGS